VGGVAVTAVVAQLLVAAGMVLVVVAVWLLAGGAWALLVAGVLLGAYGLLLVNVPEQPERAEVPGPGVSPLPSAGASRAGR
jgi:hypothetical protein